jgi:peptidoglycan hydrolase-like protein with peptidoglycan-binding domain
MRLGRVSAAIMAFGIVAASCAGSDSQEPTTSSVATTVSTAPQTTSTSSTSTTLPPTTTEAPHSGLSATTTITLVQSELKLLGYFEGSVDGIPGDVTQAALKAFQADAGIEVDGQFGPETDGKLAAVLEKNESYVTDIQEHLAELKLYSGPIDGDYGEGTTHAIEAFQKSCELEETGTLNVATRLCLADQ